MRVLSEDDEKLVKDAWGPENWLVFTVRKGDDDLQRVRFVDLDTDEPPVELTIEPLPLRGLVFAPVESTPVLALMEEDALRIARVGAAPWVSERLEQPEHGGGFRWQSAGKGFAYVDHLRRLVLVPVGDGWLGDPTVLVTDIQNVYASPTWQPGP